MTNNDFQAKIWFARYGDTKYSIKRTDSDFNKEIDTTEIMKAIKGLKNDKSASGDDITNDMLEHGPSVFIDTLKSYLITF